MPVNPTLNEAALISGLDPSTAIPAQELYVVFTLAVLACFDRKVERPFFMDVLEGAVNGIKLLRGLDAEVSIIEKCGLAVDDPSRKIFIDMADLSLKELRGIRRKLQEKMLLVEQCPTAEDKIS